MHIKLLVLEENSQNLCVTPVSHINYSPKFIVRLSVSLKHLGLRRDKGVLKRGGKVVGEGVDLDRWGKEMRRD